jgi:hypothetical protein
MSTLAFDEKKQTLAKVQSEILKDADKMGTK